jgi:phosphoglucosamine mutase
VARLFGTDGVRGVANEHLSPELAMAVAAAAATALVALRQLGTTGNPSGADSSSRDVSARPRAVVGRDPRRSGAMLEAAVVAGLCSEGVDVVRLGVLPTPAIAYLVDHYGADLGVMLSASHNPMPDNGIKLFGSGGHKLSDDLEDKIESLVMEGPLGARPTGDGVGSVRDAPDALEIYLGHLLKAVPQRLDGLKVVVDCSHGAASIAAPEVYRRAGAEVVAIANAPDGLNINDGVGSTHLEVLVGAVLEHRADLGIAHDGDADRCLAVAADGSIVDGDMILAINAIAMRERDALNDQTVVATVMSNIGFHNAMRRENIEVVTAGVGDRYVLESMRAGGLNLGGEQSGHIVFSDLATTGDGLLTALHLMARMAATKSSLADLAGVVEVSPQILLNVRVRDKAAVNASQEVADAIRAAEAELGDQGRVLLRPSGTEPVFRVMVEAATAELAMTVAQRLVEVVSRS